MNVDGATVICLPCHYEAVLITWPHTALPGLLPHSLHHYNENEGKCFDAKCLRSFSYKTHSICFNIHWNTVKAKKCVLGIKYFIWNDRPGYTTGVQAWERRELRIPICFAVKCYVVLWPVPATPIITQPTTGNSRDCLLSLIASCSCFILPTPSVRIIAVYFPLISKNIIHPSNKGFRAVRHTSEMTCSIS